ncbi:MAG: ribosome biogenesis GTP-binding protein YsxC [Polyangiaceae bacterium]|nr:ribosome biogenesis GTP-binding protein YsxC [Polyangiaceae bacterium]
MKAARTGRARAPAAARTGGARATRSRPAGAPGAPAGAGSEPWRIVSAEFEASAGELAGLPPASAPEIAFAGRSNVGKSSLMNQLMGRRGLVRTSGTPGCTRTVNFFSARARDGASYRLVDLPGYGHADRSKGERASWAKLIERYLSERAGLALVVLIVDARRGLEPDDAALFDFLGVRREPCGLVLVATKVDKLPKSQKLAALAAVRGPHGERVLGVSGETGEGLGELWRLLRAKVPPAPAAS